MERLYQICSFFQYTLLKMTFLSHRQFHTEPSSKYWLPLDDKETKRLVGVSYSGPYYYNFYVHY